MRIDLISLAKAVTHSLHIKSAAVDPEIGALREINQCCEERGLRSSAARPCLEPAAAEDRGHFGTNGIHRAAPFNAHQIIDFMAQIYAEAFADASNRISIPRKMFQREMTTEAKTLDDLAGAGDFFTLPDSELTETLIDNSLGRAENADLLMIGDGNRQSIRTWQLSE